MATNNAADAQIDSDFDGQLNWQEYIAGTDPRRPESIFKIEQLLFPNGSPNAVIQFNALSNHTYTVQYRDNGPGMPWIKAADLVAYPTNRLTSVTNTTSGASTGKRSGMAMPYAHCNECG